MQDPEGVWSPLLQGPVVCHMFVVARQDDAGVKMVERGRTGLEIVDDGGGVVSGGFVVSAMARREAAQCLWSPHGSAVLGSAQLDLCFDPTALEVVEVVMEVGCSVAGGSELSEAAG